MTPLPAAAVLDAYYLDARCRLLDLAATLDRIGRGSGADGLATDPRLARIREALAILAGNDPGRAEAIQKLFSQDYDPAWAVPQPR